MGFISNGGASTGAVISLNNSRMILSKTYITMENNTIEGNGGAILQEIVQRE
jgi:hypothetical protein